MRDSIVCLGCAANQLPEYVNAAVKAGSDTAPYLSTETVTYECGPAYSPNPSNAALECTCTPNGDNAQVSWVCNPSGTNALSNTCVASK